MKAQLIRYEKTSTHTRGVFVIDGNVFYTMERAWLNNKRNVSCIPKGRYECTFLPRSGSGKYRKVYHVCRVEGRGGILIHNGNLAQHSKGCILLGMRAGTMGGEAAVLNSRSALKKLNKLCPDGFKLEII